MDKDSIDDKHSILVHVSCGLSRYSVRIVLYFDLVNEYRESNLLTLDILTTNISGIEVGPQTVLEIYSDGVLENLQDTIINDSNCDIKKYNIGCHSRTKHIRSLRIWDSTHYNDVHNIRYCSRDDDCRDFEYCLCPNGYRQKAWCPKDGKRCLPVSRYLQSNLPEAYDGSLIDMNCLTKEHDNYMSMGAIKMQGAKCNTSNYQIEHFGLQELTNVDLITKLVLVILFIIFSYKLWNS